MPFVNPYRTKGELNEIEQWKLERHPLEIADAIIDTYSKEGPAGIAKVPGEVERLKWAGIYPQKQGGDAFMMRVKIPGGYLTAAQVREIGVVADAFGEGPDGTESRVFGSRYADLTTRQTVQIHWLRIEDIPRIWRRFAAVGPDHRPGLRRLGPQRPELPGVRGRRRRGVRRPARSPGPVSDFFTGNREYANLPRKFKISVTGCVEDCAQAEINDIGLWPARADDGTLGFNLLVGGGLSDGERMASDIDVFVAPGPGRRGHPGHRPALRRARQPREPRPGPHALPGPGARARGVPRAELAARARFELVPAGEDLTRRYRGDHVGVHPQKEDGLFYVGLLGAGRAG